MAEVPFERRSLAWQESIVPALTGDFVIRPAADYAPGDHATMYSEERGARGAVVTSRFWLTLKKATEPLALEIALRDLLGETYDSSAFSTVHAAPLKATEVMQLASISSLALSDESLRAIRSRDDTTAWGRGRRIAEEGGAELVVRTTRAGPLSLSVEKNLTKADMTRFIAPMDQETFRYGYRDLESFARLVSRVNDELQPRPNQITDLKVCFVATAVYGSYDGPQLWTLRRWRDQSLLRRPMGRQLVKVYYSVGPSAAHLLANSPRMSHLVRSVLDRFVGRLRRSGYSGAPYKDL